MAITKIHNLGKRRHESMLVMSYCQITVLLEYGGKFYYPILSCPLSILLIIGFAITTHILVVVTRYTDRNIFFSEHIQIAIYIVLLQIRSLVVSYAQSQSIPSYNHFDSDDPPLYAIIYGAQQMSYFIQIQTEFACVH